MSLTTPICTVTADNSAQWALKRLAQASECPSHALSGGALQALIQLAAMAYPTFGEGDIVSASFFTAELDQLEKLGYLRRVGDDEIELI